MKNKFIITALLSAFLLIAPNVKAANFTDNQTVDANKIWTIKFTGNVGLDDGKIQGITVTDSTGAAISVGVQLGQDSKTVIVTAPEGGYIPGESYTLNVGTKAHSSKGTALKNEYKVHFNIKNEITIKQINNLTAIVTQNDSYTLPITVQATMNNWSTKQVAIIWDKKVDTSQPGTFTFKGTVTGYSGNVILTLIVNVKNNSVVTFKDRNLEQLVRSKIGKPTGDIYKNDVEKITELTIGYYVVEATETIEDISGIENLTNLQSLNLHDNQINDMSPLKNLTKLQYLNLSANQISDITTLKNLTSLKTLDLYYNQISDISPLSGLSNLQYLNLGYDSSGGTPVRHPFPTTYNQISDISPLKNLTNLQNLNLGYNKITDIKPLQGLTNLVELDLGDNKISDISCILALKCPKLRLLDLSNNQISDISVFKKEFQDPHFGSYCVINLFNNQISNADIQYLKNALPEYRINEIIAKKPNIYLYPEKTEELSVYVTPKGKVTKSIPEYNEGWKVTVDPSGKIDNTYDFLFYEAAIDYSFTLNKGWIVDKDNFNEEMNNILTSIGLNSKEKADFIEYWSKRLNWQNSRYVAYYLDPKEINEAIKLNLSKEPDSILRAFFYFVPFNDNENLNIQKPEIQEFKRNGFTVVEWGGIYK